MVSTVNRFRTLFQDKPVLEYLSVSNTDISFRLLNFVWKNIGELLNVLHLHFA